MAKWFYSLGDVNIHAMNEYAFIHACCNGHIKIAQWLYSLDDINIHINDEYVFRNVCSYGQIEMAQWLCCLYEYYYIEIKNNKIINYDDKNYKFRFYIKII